MGSVQPRPDVYATLLLNDRYLVGALVLAKALRDGGAKHDLAVLVTLDKVSTDTVTTLQKVYKYVIPVETVTNSDTTGLSIMNRLDLAATFTKLALWTQTQFRRIVYLDADTLPLHAPEELFDLALDGTHPFAAAPELGFPDCFNSGVMVVEPDAATYSALVERAQREGSFDGGDQGVLNAFFPLGSYERLSFGYNVELHHVYRMYMPAVKFYQAKLRIVHFIGGVKPWDRERGKVEGDGSAYSKAYAEFVDKWWAVREGLGWEEEKV